MSDRTPPFLAEMLSNPFPTHVVRIVEIDGSTGELWFYSNNGVLILCDSEPLDFTVV